MRTALSPARDTFVAAAAEFRTAVRAEVEQLAQDIARARGRGHVQLAGDLAQWRDRLVHLAELGDGVAKEPGVRH